MPVSSHKFTGSTPLPLCVLEPGAERQSFIGATNTMQPFQTKTEAKREFPIERLFVTHPTARRVKHVTILPHRVGWSAARCGYRHGTGRNHTRKSGWQRRICPQFSVRHGARNHTRAIARPVLEPSTCPSGEPRRCTIISRLCEPGPRRRNGAGCAWPGSSSVCHPLPNAKFRQTAQQPNRQFH